jgi:hypothetical protein
MSSFGITDPNFCKKNRTVEKLGQFYVKNGESCPNLHKVHIYARYSLEK